MSTNWRYGLFFTFFLVAISAILCIYQNDSVVSRHNNFKYKVKRKKYVSQLCKDIQSALGNNVITQFPILHPSTTYNDRFVQLERIEVFFSKRTQYFVILS